jgi:hypothetical protein
MRTLRSLHTFRGRAAVGISVVVLVVLPQADHAASTRSTYSTGSTSAAAPAYVPVPAVGVATASVTPPSVPPPESLALAAPPGGPDTASPAGLDASASGVASTLAADGFPSTALEAYVRAAVTGPASCHIAWPLVAAIGRVESNHGRFAGAVLHTDGRSTPPIIGIALDGVRTALIRDTDAGQLDGDPVYDRAVGPMQFIPSTWRTYAADGDGDGRSDPFDIHDAAAATAKYLCAAGGDLSSVAGQTRAVLAYNHSHSYVATVLTLAAMYAGTPPPQLRTPATEPLPTMPPANPAPPPAVPVVLAPAPTAEPPMPPTSLATTGAPPSPTVPTGPADTSAPPPSATPAPTTAPSSTAPSSPQTTTPPPSSTAPSITAPSTPQTTTPPASSTAPSTPQTTTPPPSTTASSTPSITPPPSSTPPSPTTPTPTTRCSSGSLQGAPAIVDLRDGSGDPALATELAARLAAAGIQVGAVTPTDATTSAVQYPDGQRQQAGVLAVGLGLAGSEQPAPVNRVTVVIGAQDSERLLTTPSIC